MLPDDPIYFKTGGRRLVAALIDFLVLSPLFFLDGAVWRSNWGTPLKWWLLSASAVCFAAYSPIAHAVFGQTVGKWMTRIRVVGLRGEPLGWGRAVLRDCLPLVACGYWLFAYSGYLDTGNVPGDPGFRLSERDSWLQDAQSVWVILEIASMFTNSRRRALHDFIAGSVVIRAK